MIPRHARIDVRSALPPETLGAIARHVGASVVSPVPLGAHVQVVGGDEHTTDFVVTSFGGRTDLMRFTFTAYAEASGGSVGTATIGVVSIVQRRVLGVPVERRGLQGWAQFQRFALGLDAAVRAADPAAVVTFSTRRGSRPEPVTAPDRVAERVS